MNKGLIFGLCVATAILRIFSQTLDEGADSGAVADGKNAKQALKERMTADKEELRQIKLVDSVGWIKVTAIKRPGINKDDLAKERVRRKVAALTGLCEESKFATLAEVDSLGGMTADEKVFCKERLKNANPSIN
jgi:hypothetical protein